MGLSLSCISSEKVSSRWDMIDSVREEDMSQSVMEVTLGHRERWSVYHGLRGRIDGQVGPFKTEIK